MTEIKGEDQTENILNSILRKSKKPLSTFDLFNQAYKTNNIDRVSVQNAIWNLVDGGKVVVRNDRRLEPSPQSVD